ncbi:hypothetical protein NDU88_001949 [Pleurodeles waltl]|uniref:Thioredoxin domain-containing protein 16 n=1 Tax=Pleurodeles waltl TaxID=8319 RepID=A0AAV7TKL8_PLEWA|nr:hypothetical protein NDU88_001949 [Pleurodeles waltl]
MDALLRCFITTFFWAAVLPLIGAAFQELTYQDYLSSLDRGKLSLVYFSYDISSSISFFLEELNKSVEPLQDYGISVAKVNCIEKEVSTYCGYENVYLFRGNILLRMFPKDTLFDVNAIIANVLFTILFNEVKYITLFEEFQKTEIEMKGKRDLVFAYVRATGIPEHRAVMEAAFVYGTKYQFVLTTEFNVLANLGVDKSDIFSAVLLFFNCKVMSDSTHSCRRTILEQSLTTLNIHRFFKLMEAPLVTVVDKDPRQISNVHLELGLPLIFIISRKNTYADDKETAEHLAWNLKGRAGVSILLRENLNIPLGANIAFKRPEEGGDITFLALENIEEISSFIEETGNEEKTKIYELKDEDVKFRPEQDAQDDQVAEAVYRDRKRKLPLELIRPLKDNTFYKTVSRDNYTVVLFYVQWEGVSMAFLQSFIEVSVRLKQTPGVLMAMLNCGDWPDVCSREKVIDLPQTRVYFQKEKPLIYDGMLGTEALYRFIVMSQTYNTSFPKHSGTDVGQMSYDSSNVPAEITVENLPLFLQYQKPLLILFSDGKLGESEKIEMSRLVKGMYKDSFCTCWLNLRNTPAGRGILQQYFSSTPDLPVLVLVDVYNKGYVFAFPSYYAITEESILHWLNMIDSGLEQPITLLSEKEWLPPLPHYNFLAMMDATTPNFASQKIPIHFHSNSFHTSEKDEHEKMETGAKLKGQERRSKRRLEL